MKTAKTIRRGFRPGQTMVEYVLALIGVVAVAGVLAYLVTAAQKSAERTTALVSSDYP